MASLTLLNPDQTTQICSIRCSQLTVCHIYLGCVCMGWSNMTDLQAEEEFFISYNLLVKRYNEILKQSIRKLMCWQGTVGVCDNFTLIYF